jgi:Holliday junction resolvase RusA-like endonuclease
MNQEITTLKFVVMGEPVGKERARSVRGARHYTPEKTKAYERLVALSAQAELALLPKLDLALWPTMDQVYMDLWISHRTGKKPDADNVVKAIQDGLSGILWKNDNNVLPRVWGVSWPSSEPNVVVRIVETGEWRDGYA